MPSIKDYSSLPPIRLHWLNFYASVISFAEATKSNLSICEMPLWQMTPEYVAELAYSHDAILMPHKQRAHGWDIKNIFFYMQTVFPERFTVDPLGWGANLSFLPLNLMPYRISKRDFNDADDYLGELKKRINNNQSKFEQPSSGRVVERHDVLFVCQIPHDETIKYHSDVTVAEALGRVLSDSKEKGYTVLVKGHPVNPASMSILKKLTGGFDNATWTDSISIHDAIRACKVVALVNSGVGFEAMIHNKPIFSYGRSEYQNVVNYKKSVDINNNNMIDYTSFLYDFFHNHTVDTTDQFQFNRILERTIYGNDSNY